ncbi:MULTISPECIES: ANR family transcriptional regulator [Serratia]|uniref:ANR family transcriptional regulator n=1 Tax=Serratia TaxID=613 RepID=UPI00164FD570|nr:ANR family transcriptional regulator [Serratia bockelmannii]
MGTYDAYRNIARIAAECEQRGWYEKAAEVWEKSLKLARAVDVPWIKIRIEFCVNAAVRCWGGEN